jgi:YtkA-like
VIGSVALTILCSVPPQIRLGARIAYEGGRNVPHNLPLLQRKAQADVTIGFSPDPPSRGMNVFEATIVGPNHAPLQDLDVTLTLEMPDMLDMPGMKRVVAMKPPDDKTKAPGRYAAKTQLTMAGGWKLTVIAKSRGQVIVSKTVTITVK